MDNGWTLFAGGFILCCVGAVSLVVVYCVVECYAFLRRNASSFSPKTLRLYRSLVNSLMVEIAVCICAGAVPVAGIAISFADWASSVVHTCMCAGSLYPLASHVIWLTNITPYRRAFLQTTGISRWLRRTKSESTVFLASSSAETRA